MSAARLLIAGLVATVIAACGLSSEDRERITVSAASSLGSAFADIERRFEAHHPRYDVVLNLGASSLLREQILSGAPADVFAPADLSNMTEVQSRGLVVGQPAIFAGNRLEIGVPPGNPGGVEGLSSFAAEELLIGLCEERVPCGALARRALENANIQPMVDTNEPNVTALVTKLEATELDAGIVYVSDVKAADGAIEGIPVPEAFNVATDYPIAALTASAGARALLDFVLSDEGAGILVRHGFEGR